MLPDLFGNIVILPNHHFMTTAYNSTQKRFIILRLRKANLIETKGEIPGIMERYLNPF